MKEEVSNICLEGIFVSISKQIQNVDRMPCIIGINGIDTSGKTNFSKAFLNYLKSMGQKAILIHLDDFHNPSNIRIMGNDEIDAYINNAFNLGL